MIRPSFSHILARSSRCLPEYMSIFPLVVGILLLSTTLAHGFQPDEDLTARAAVLIDAVSGKVLYQKEGDLRLPPASTTKVMTALVTLESGRKFNEMLTVSKEATRVPAMKLYLRPGQTISIDDLLYSALLSSANDAAVVLAEGIGGSVEHFAELMTLKARQIGATNTNFTNPHGLTAPEHYSSAKDLALIFRYAMRNPTFREIVQTKISSVSSSTVVRNKTVLRRISVRNHNRLLWNFDGALGGKTGYTAAAQKCFVGAVQRNDMTLIVAILGARDQWGDTRKLLEYGFDNYQELKAGTPVAPKPAGEHVSIRSENLSALLPQSAYAGTTSAAGYIVQIGTFRELNRAESVLKSLKQKGHDGFVEKVSIDRNQTAYRVRFGPYADWQQAQEIAQDAHARSGLQAVILPFQPQQESRGDAG